jgi:hypothetical protein
VSSVRDDYCDPISGLVLDANTGTVIEGFDSDRPPAFFGDIALFFRTGTLVGVENGWVLWSFAGDGALKLAPLVADLFRGAYNCDAPWAVADFDPAQFLARF